MSPPCHTSRRLLESSKNALTCTGRPVRAGRGRKQNARPVGSRECLRGGRGAFGSSSRTFRRTLPSRVPRRPPPTARAASRTFRGPSRRANATAQRPAPARRRRRAETKRYLRRRLDAEELSKTSSNSTDSGSILAAAPFSACAAEARANAPRAETSDRDAMASVAIFATESSSARRRRRATRKSQPPRRILKTACQAPLHPRSREEACARRLCRTTPSRALNYQPALSCAAGTGTSCRGTRARPHPGETAQTGRVFGTRRFSRNRRACRVRARDVREERRVRVEIHHVSSGDERRHVRQVVHGVEPDPEAAGFANLLASSRWS